VTLGVSAHKNYIWGVLPPNPVFVGREEISSLNVGSNNFRTVWLILVIGSSNDATPLKKFGCRGKLLKFAFLELLINKTTRESFPAKILHSITF
jgi:hypothetical protein